MLVPVRLLLLFASSLLLINAPVATSLSFEYTKFDASAVAPSCSSKQVKSICLQGDATVDGAGVVQLTRYEQTTPQTFSAGKVSYTWPLHLWDKATGAVTDFSTSFSFAITNNVTTIADGIAFVLSRYPSQTAENSDGGNLGLVSFSNPFNASGDQSFVAVEFDSFMNSEYSDPSSNHIGIDINSVRSVVSTNLIGSSFTAFATGSAQVSYSSNTRTLSVTLDYNGKRYKLSYVVDLKSILPERVSVGFTGATGAYGEFNKILSWSFRSTM